MESYSLKEVNQYIKQVISLNFEDSLWIDAEISQVKEVRGQMYLELIDKHEGVEEINAKAQAVIWYKSLLFIKRKLGELTSSILEAGRQVRIKAKVDFHEIYGLKLDIEDIDLSFSIGMAELNRQKTIGRIEQTKNDRKAKKREFTLQKSRNGIAAYYKKYCYYKLVKGSRIARFCTAFT